MYGSQTYILCCTVLVLQHSSGPVDKRHIKYIAYTETTTSSSTRIMVILPASCVENDKRSCDIEYIRDSQTHFINYIMLLLLASSGECNKQYIKSIAYPNFKLIPELYHAYIRSFKFQMHSRTSTHNPYHSTREKRAPHGRLPVEPQIKTSNLCIQGSKPCLSGPFYIQLKRSCNKIIKSFYLRKRSTTLLIWV